MILSIPCSIAQVDDTLSWHYDKLGYFSVKSGYHLGCNLLSRPSSLGLSGSESWWKFLWRLTVPSKIKLLIWKACHEWLPTMAVLTKRKMTMDSLCPLCKTRPETILLALWRCPSLKLVRTMCPFVKGIRATDDTHFFDFILACKHQLLLEEMELICTVIISDAMHAKRGNLVNVSRPSIDVSSWSPLLVGSFKINTDAAIDATRKKVGIGIIIRDSSGAVMVSSSQSFDAGYDSQVAESVAILRGIQLALDTGLWQCTVESDAQVVVNLINSKSCVNSDVDLIITNILYLLGNLSDCSVRFAPRIANRAAHSLAKLG
ncbi:hypothetical protein Dsin_028354 [Dipteronia sinensis]|uniref:Uncharacterized protein n=1 Tax=Dipteronia sinensis TaxID=43782 RepID=A0AAD9ZQI0_9ROSI|nr:hypothetical protein Dsin_028354 [Dipteronia sinensis]